jgi:hypothetical protein
MIYRRTAQRGLVILIMGVLVAGCASYPPISGLRPEYPNARRNIVVNSLTPTFRWEPFPGHYDPGMELDRIRHVTYDLRIFRAESEEFEFTYPAEVVYERHGLTEPSHKIEMLLQPFTQYYWTIRARFELDGQPRVTQWGLAWKFGVNEWGTDGLSSSIFTSHFDQIMSRVPRVPNPYYFDFETPAKPR